MCPQCIGFLVENLENGGHLAAKGDLAIPVEKYSNLIYPYFSRGIGRSRLATTGPPSRTK